MIIYKSPDEIAKMRVAGRITADAIQAMLERVAPGMTTADLDAIAEDSIRRAGGIPSFLDYKGTYPATICASVNDEIVHGIPSNDAGAEGGRRAVPRLRSHLGRFPGGFRRHRDRRRPAALAGGRQARAGDRGRAGCRHRRGPPRREALRHRRRRSSRSPREPGSRWSGSTAVTASDERCTRTPSSRTSVPRTGSRAQAGPGGRGGAHGDAREPRDQGASGRMDRGHGRRVAGGPFRAHDRRDR